MKIALHPNPKAPHTSDSRNLRLLQQESIVPLKYVECGVYGDLIMIYPKPYSIYLRGTVGLRVLSLGLGFLWSSR